MLMCIKISEGSQCQEKKLAINTTAKQEFKYHPMTSNY